MVVDGASTTSGKNTASILSFYILLSVSCSIFAGQFEQGMHSLKAGDFAEAFCLWRPLAMQGDQDAAYHLGWLYANGNGLRVDVPKAVYWWTQAANQGHMDAMFALGMAYTTGEGIKQDSSEALRWYLQAADAGHEDAREFIRTKVKTGAGEIQNQLEKLIGTSWLGEPVRIKVEKANLRSGPGTGYKLVETALMGSKFIAIDQKNGWYQVINPNDRSVSWVAGWLADPSLEQGREH